ncbi:hypothetical protein BDP27DRAFT_1435110 [Rhodocollybia butyracea]|uniref:ATP-dependent DNA helicase RecQ zinc-binding domain-containing protein n=1 Tax=Rhodocollybia butyracea TaxID=206335 RepID=A0A9P5P4S9_9AGAR|nr:hypothetical protein BDP27DRAFT_1435110 [Rhodocollybia butyracea]
MLEFAQNLTRCRKIQFANYFSHTTELSVTPWSTSDASAWGPCGHCDNCTRTPEDYLDKDATIQAWQLLRIIEKVQKTTGNVTLANVTLAKVTLAKVTLAKVTELARSSMGKVFVGTGSKKKHAGTKNEVSIDLDAVCEGKVDMTKECYLRDHSYTTAYKTIALYPIAQGSGAHSGFFPHKSGEDAFQVLKYRDASEFFLDTDDQEEVDIFGDESRKAWSENFSRKSSTSTLKSQKRKPLVIISDSENNGDDAEGQEDESRKGKVAWSANSKKSSTSTLKSQKRKPLVIISDSESDGDDVEGQEDECSGDEDVAKGGIKDWSMLYTNKSSLCFTDICKRYTSSLTSKLKMVRQYSQPEVTATLALAFQAPPEIISLPFGQTWSSFLLF